MAVDTRRQRCHSRSSSLFRSVSLAAYLPFSSPLLPLRVTSYFHSPRCFTTYVLRFSSSLFSESFVAGFVAVSSFVFEAERGLGFFGEDDTNVGSEEGVTFHGGYVYHDGVKIGDNETSSPCFFSFDSAAPARYGLSRSFKIFSFRSPASFLSSVLPFLRVFSGQCFFLLLSFGGSYRLEFRINANFLLYLFIYFFTRFFDLSLYFSLLAMIFYRFCPTFSL